MTAGDTPLGPHPGASSDGGNLGVYIRVFFGGVEGRFSFLTHLDSLKIFTLILVLA